MNQQKKSLFVTSLREGKLWNSGNRLSKATIPNHPALDHLEKKIIDYRVLVYCVLLRAWPAQKTPYSGKVTRKIVLHDTGCWGPKKFGGLWEEKPKQKTNPSSEVGDGADQPTLWSNSFTETLQEIVCTKTNP